MAFNVFIEVDQTKIDKLPFIEVAYQYYFEDSTDRMHLGVVYELSRDTYDKASDRLKGQGTDKIKSGDKVYIMPGSKIPMFKLKDHCKKIGAVVIGEIEKATFFIGTKGVSEKGNHGNWTPRAASLMWEDKSPNIVVSGSEKEAFEELQETGKILATKSWDSLKDSWGKYTRMYVAAYLSGCISNTIASSEKKSFFITPAGASIIYHSILKKIPIVNEEDILEQISPAAVIDEYTYDSIESMLDSSDDESQEVGVEILANCDIPKSMFYLWKLSKKYYQVVVKVHTKNVRLFVERSDWGTLHGSNAEEFIEYLYDKKLLTKEYFQLLVGEASSNYKLSLNTPVFGIVLCPTEKYKKFAEKENVYEFHHADECTVTEEILETND
jgi:hypothetical protein